MEQDKAMLVEKVRSTFNKFDSTMISMAASRDRDTVKYENCKNTRDEIIQSVKQSGDEFQDCFCRLVVAEYKEYIHGNLFDPCFEAIEQSILAEYDEFMLKGDNLRLVFGEYHDHDPEHFLFKEASSYEFYDKVEIHGYNIVSMWDSEEALQEFMVEMYYED